jgi:hypothetical protein
MCEEQALPSIVTILPHSRSSKQVRNLDMLRCSVTPIKLPEPGPYGVLFPSPVSRLPSPVSRLPSPNLLSKMNMN